MVVIVIVIVASILVEKMSLMHCWTPFPSKMELLMGYLLLFKIFFTSCSFIFLFFFISLFFCNLIVLLGQVHYCIVLHHENVKYVLKLYGFSYLSIYLELLKHDQ